MAKLKILKAGETDINSTDIWRFCMHSDYPVFKIGTSGSNALSLTAGNQYAEFTVSHNLGYKPIYLANILYGTKEYVVQSSTVPYTDDSYILIPSTGGDSVLSMYSTVTDNDIIIGVSLIDGELATGTTNFTVYWTIYLDEF